MHKKAGKTEEKETKCGDGRSEPLTGVTASGEEIRPFPDPEKRIGTSCFDADSQSQRVLLRAAFCSFRAFIRNCTPGEKLSRRTEMTTWRTEQKSRGVFYVCAKNGSLTCISMGELLQL